MTTVAPSTTPEPVLTQADVLNIQGAVTRGVMLAGLYWLLIGIAFGAFAALIHYGG